MGVIHRDSVTLPGVFIENIRGQAFGFFAEDQEITTPKAGFTIGLIGFFAEKEKAFYGVRGHKGGKIIPIDDIYIGPIVQPGPF